MAANERALQYRVGERIHGFTVQQVSAARRRPALCLCTGTSPRLGQARRLRIKYWLCVVRHKYYSGVPCIYRSANKYFQCH